MADMDRIKEDRSVVLLTQTKGVGRDAAIQIDVHWLCPVVGGINWNRLIQPVGSHGSDEPDVFSVLVYLNFGVIIPYADFFIVF